MPDYHEGKFLEEWMFENRTDVKTLASKLNISGPAVRKQMKQEVVSKSFKSKLKDAGIEIFNQSKPAAGQTQIVFTQLLREKDRTIDQKNEMIQQLIKTIDLQNKFVESATGKKVEEGKSKVGFNKDHPHAKTRAHQHT